jgi:hypothetical protein
VAFASENGLRQDDATGRGARHIPVLPQPPLLSASGAWVWGARAEEYPVTGVIMLYCCCRCNERRAFGAWME